jgi:hypothetical protein
VNSLASIAVIRRLPLLGGHAGRNGRFLVSLGERDTRLVRTANDDQPNDRKRSSGVQDSHGPVSFSASRKRETLIATALSEASANQVSVHKLAFSWHRSVYQISPPGLTLAKKTIANFIEKASRL